MPIQIMDESNNAVMQGLEWENVRTGEVCDVVFGGGGSSSRSE